LEAQVTAGERELGSGPILAQQPDQTGETESAVQRRAEQIEEHRYGQPEVLEGPFGTRQLLRLDEALRTADRATGLTFSVYVGQLEEPVREHAERLHQQLPNVATAVLIAVSPNQRVLEVVTGGDARRRIPDRDAKLAALSMVAAFGGGDLAGGIISGLDQLATRAGRS
jgi:hypothetical protein